MSIYSKLAMLAVIIVAVVVAGLALSRGNDGNRHQTPESGPSALATGEATAAEGAKVNWHHSLPDALAEAKGRKTLILVDFHADWCGWCTKLDQETLSNAEVQTRLRDFTLLKIDTDKYPDIANKYGVSGLPTTAILDANGKAMLSQPGYMTPKDYLQFLAQADM
ncbi:MAG: thioredoxin family protein [Armatimonadota bacterium]